MRNLLSSLAVAAVISCLAELPMLNRAEAISFGAIESASMIELTQYPPGTRTETEYGKLRSSKERSRDAAQADKWSLQGCYWVPDLFNWPKGSYVCKSKEEYGAVSPRYPAEKALKPR
jgi:hypothetical protein